VACVMLFYPPRLDGLQELILASVPGSSLGSGSRLKKRVGVFESGLGDDANKYELPWTGNVHQTGFRGLLSWGGSFRFPL